MPRMAGLAVLFATILVSGLVRAEDEATRLAHRIEDLYGAATSFRAEFTQTYRNKAQGTKKVSSGSFAAARGGKLSFRYSTPRGDRVVSNGEVVKAYDAAAKRMYEVKLTRARHAGAAVFVLDKLKLTRDFRLRLLDPRRKKIKQGSVLVAVPKRPSPELALLVLYVDPVTAQVLRVLVVDAQKNTNRFDFRSRTFNAKLAAGEFRFKAPAGTRVIKP